MTQVRQRRNRRRRTTLPPSPLFFLFLLNKRVVTGAFPVARTILLMNEYSWVGPRFSVRRKMRFERG